MSQTPCMERNTGRIFIMQFRKYISKRAAVTNEFQEWEWEEGLRLRRQGTRQYQASLLWRLEASFCCTGQVTRHCGLPKLRAVFLTEYYESRDKVCSQKAVYNMMQHRKLGILSSPHQLKIVMTNLKQNSSNDQVFLCRNESTNSSTLKNQAIASSTSLSQATISGRV